MCAALRFILFAVLIIGSLSMILPPGGGCPGCPSEATTNDLRVTEAAEFVISELGNEYQLVTIRRAQTQVVAGENVYLWLTVQKNGRQRRCEAVVFFSLFDTKELTSTTCR